MKRRLGGMAGLLAVVVFGLVTPVGPAVAGPPGPPDPRKLAAERAEVLRGDGSGKSGGSADVRATGTWDGPPVGGNLVAVGERHTCGVTTAGRIWCWGGGRTLPELVGTKEIFSPVRDDPYAPTDTRAATDIDAGGDHTCAVVNDYYDLSTTKGVLYCWGLGNRPVRVMAEVDKVAAGRDHTCVITGDQTVACFGSNDSGQLGRGTVGGEFPEPAVVPGLTGIVSLGAGGANTCAVGARGRAWCWGSDDHGQLGDGSGPGAPSGVPVRVATTGVLGGFRQIDVGAHHVCATGTERDWRAWCWGSDDHGQLGNGTAGTDEPAPVLVEDSDTLVTVDLGGDSSCYTNYSSDAIVIGEFTPAVSCWGDNSEGQLGVGDRANRSAPVVVARGAIERSASAQAFYGYAEPLLVDVTAGAGHTCAADIDSAVYCWGSNEAGQLGNGLDEDADEPVKTRLGPGPVRAVEVAAGDAALGVRWQPPADTGVAPAIQSYVVFVRSDADESGMLSTQETSIAFDGLTNGAAHTVIVAGFTLAGLSYSDPRTGTPLAAAPPAKPAPTLPVTGPAAPPAILVGVAFLLLGAALSLRLRRPGGR